MRIAIDVTPGSQGAGIGRYALGVARAIARLRPDVDLSVFSTDLARRRASEIPPGTAWIERPRRDRALRAEIAARHFLRLPADDWFPGRDLFHATDHLLPPLRRVASVFTLHDLACLRAPETQTTLHRAYSRLMLPRFARAADMVIAVSESTRRDAIHLLGLAPERVRTVPLATPEGFRPASPDAVRAARQRLGLPERYLLAVGTLEPRKNHTVLFRALANGDARMRLVVAGRRGWRSEGILRALSASGAADRVQLLGFVPDEDLPAVYSGAAGSLFPSLYEGFGIPVLEAMACGTPVAASRTSSLPEVVGDAAVLLAPDDVDGWRDVMRRMWDDDPALPGRGGAGVARAAAFGWDRVVSGTLATYEEAHARRA